MPECRGVGSPLISFGIGLALSIRRPDSKPCSSIALERKASAATITGG
jgi:hypothetical protein